MLRAQVGLVRKKTEEDVLCKWCARQPGVSHLVARDCQQSYSVLQNIFSIVFSTSSNSAIYQKLLTPAPSHLFSPHAGLYKDEHNTVEDGVDGDCMLANRLDPPFPPQHVLPSLAMCHQIRCVTSAFQQDPRIDPDL